MPNLHNPSSLSPSPCARDERRVGPRATLDVLANRFLDGYPYLCRTEDISREGMRVRRLSDPDSAARFIGLQFQLPGSEEVITASGEIVSTREESRSVGVRFTHLPSRARKAIDHYLQRACG